MRFNRKLGYLLAVVCLALMVVALGAAAKHSQFESQFHSTDYLKQSVKMVSSGDPAILVPPDTAATILAAFAPAPIFPQPVPATVPVPVLSPLLI